MYRSAAAGPGTTEGRGTPGGRSPVTSGTPAQRVRPPARTALRAAVMQGKVRRTGRGLYALVPSAPGPDDDSPPADHAQHGDGIGSTVSEPGVAPIHPAPAASPPLRGQRDGSK
jgi:hypothetical protein